MRSETGFCGAAAGEIGRRKVCSLISHSPLGVLTILSKPLQTGNHVDTSNFRSRLRPTISCSLRSPYISSCQPPSTRLVVSNGSDPCFQKGLWKEVG